MMTPPALLCVLSLLSIQASLAIISLIALEIRQATDTLSVCPISHPRLFCIARGARRLEPDGPRTGLIRRDPTRQEGGTPIPRLSSKEARRQTWS